MPDQLVPVNGNNQLELFDERPIDLGGFKLKARSAVHVGRPTIKQWQAALEFASAAHEGSPYWVGDLVAYAEGREDWREKLDQAISVTRLARHTLHNLGYVSRRVDEDARQLSPSLAHSAEVAPMPPARQRRWLEKARTEGWTVREMRSEIRASQRRKIIEGQAALEGMFRILYADPSWKYRSSSPTADGSLRKANERYHTMTIEEMMKLPVAAHAHKRASLFMWVTAPMLYPKAGQPGPNELAAAWGFPDYKENWVWDKVLGNPGSYSHVVHEHLILFTRDGDLPDMTIGLPKSVLTIRRGDDWEHSQKPEDVRQMIEKHWTVGPYLELFGRRRVEGWTVFGHDARLWHRQAKAS
jgi:N6-adenosine-specific RNA methylase IME4